MNIRELGIMGLDLPGILRSFALSQLIPAHLSKDLQRVRHDLRDYMACRTWVFDQVAASRSVGGKSLAPSDLMNLGETQKEEEDTEWPTEAPSHETLLAVWKGQQKGKTWGCCAAK